MTRPTSNQHTPQEKQMDNPKLNLSVARMLAAGLVAGLGIRSAATPKRRTRVPMMVTAPAEAIAAWNAEVDKGNQARAAQRRDRRLAKALKDNGQHPKFLKARAHKQAKHPLRDQHGALTFVGKPCELVGIKPSSREFEIEGGSDHGERFYTVRRIWLAGISAQRGY